MMKRGSLGLKLVVLGALALMAGCSGGDEPGSTSAGMTGSTAATSAVATDAPTTATESSDERRGTASSERVRARPAPAAPPTPPLGSPVAGLDAVQEALFVDGLSDFNTVDVPPELGPIFNGPVFNEGGVTSPHEAPTLRFPPAPPTTMACGTCHTVNGGSNGSVEERFGQTAANGTFNALSDEGGSLLQFFAVPGAKAEVVPTSDAFAAVANTFALRRTTALYGAGLIEAIPDAAIEANQQAELAADPTTAGTVIIDEDASDNNTLRVGRFGWKDQEPTLPAFAGDAYFNELDVSNLVFPFENVANGATVSVPLANVKDTPNPVVVPGQTLELTDIQRFTNFMRGLALPASHQPEAVLTAQQLQGQQLFKSAACETCHTPSFETVSSIEALNGKTLFAYSDFLVHDVGTGDGIVQGQCLGNQIRTAPLIAVLGHGLMHDAGSPTIEAAIARHANQGAQSKALFEALTPAEQAALVAFVGNL